jgi:hypothetical protein
MSILSKPQKLDIVLKRIHHHFSSASTIRYRRAEVLAKVLLSIDIYEILVAKYCFKFQISHEILLVFIENKIDKINFYYNKVT